MVAINFDLSKVVPLINHVENRREWIDRHIDAAISDLMRTGRGCRNNALNTAAFKLGRFVGADLIDEQWATDELTTTAQALGMKPWEIRGTIASGLAAGIRKPWEDRSIGRGIPRSSPPRLIITAESAEAEAARKTEAARKVYGLSLIHI